MNTTIDELEKAERRRRRRIAIAIILMVTGLLFISARFWLFLPGLQNTLLFRLTLMYGTIIILAGFSLALYVYLQTGFKSPFPEASLRPADSESLRDLYSRFETKLAYSDDLIDKFGKELSGLHDEIKSVEKSQQLVTDQQRHELIGELVTKLKSEAATDVLDSIKQKTRNEVKSDFAQEAAHSHFRGTQRRLQDEIGALSRRGNLNLILGIVTTALGLLILAYAVFYATPSAKDPVLVAIYYLPRLTLVIFIELFAYFFLKLYKSSLTEIKYFQNELTNAEAKFSALRVALGSEDKDLKSKVIEEMAKTERNFILKKGESTVELEHARLDKEAMTEAIKAASEAIKKAKE